LTAPWLSVVFGKLADFDGTLSRGSHVAIEGRTPQPTNTKRQVAVGTQKTTLPERVWEIRVNSVLKLDRAATRRNH
jgi:single-strand DNA-binding protein